MRNPLYREVKRGDGTAAASLETVFFRKAKSAILRLVAPLIHVSAGREQRHGKFDCRLDISSCEAQRAHVETMWFLREAFH